MVADIANSADEQSSGIAAIRSAVSETDGWTQQNAAMAQETTGARDRLADESARLETLIKQFHVGGQRPVPFAHAIEPAGFARRGRA